MMGVRDDSFRDGMFDVAIEHQSHLWCRLLPCDLETVMCGLIPDCLFRCLLDSSCYHQRSSPRVASVASMMLQDAMLLPLQFGLDLINRNALRTVKG